MSSIYDYRVHIDLIQSQNEGFYYFNFALAKNRQMKTRTQRRQEVVKEEQVKKDKQNVIPQEVDKENKRRRTEGDGNKKVKVQDPVSDDKPKKGRGRPVRVTDHVAQQKDIKKDEPEQIKLTKTELRRRTAENILNRQKAKEDEEKQKVKKIPVEQQSKKSEPEDDKKGGHDKQDVKEQVKKFTFKGKIPIDEFCSLNNTNHSILHYQGKTYSATLNQSNVQNNNNKFYILQIIQSDSNSNNCFIFTRWGRVGVPGQKSQVGPYPIASAIRQYNLKYHEKHNRGNYREIQLNYEAEEDKKIEVQVKDKKKDSKQHFSESKLPLSVKKLISLIFDINMMNKHMLEIGYDVSRMPLGKLSKDNIMKGYKILQDLINEIKGKDNKKKIEELTNDFYSFIPHNFGFAKMANFALNDQVKVKKKIEMLQALAEIKVATNLIGNPSSNENILDSNYSKLNRQINPVDHDTNEFEVINKYLQSTHAITHGGYSLQLQHLFSLRGQLEDIRYTNDVGNKMLLWHGSRLTNYVGILSQGLRIAPPEAPVTGYMFGKGVYFADMSSKSANYCFTSPQNYTGILLLCEVALGQMNEKFHADPYSANLPPGKLSTKGLGRVAPKDQNIVQLQKGIAIPMGPGQPTNRLGCSLMYNQFIVYDVAQIKIKYLLRTKFNYKHR